MSDVTLYQSRLADVGADHLAFARETTQADVDAGAAAAAGDFLVLRDQLGVVQWWTRAAFLRAYEPVGNDDSAQPETSIDLAGELLRQTPASTSSAAAAPIVSPIVEHMTASAQLEQGIGENDAGAILDALTSLDRNTIGFVELLAQQRSLLDQARVNVGELLLTDAELSRRIESTAQRTADVEQVAEQLRVDVGRLSLAVEQLQGGLRNLDSRTEHLA